VTRAGPVIAFIGAGSVVFTRNLLTDIFLFEDLHGATITLHDIDAGRLDTAGMMARRTSTQLGAGATVVECPERRAAVDGADFVINAVQIGMHEATLIDFAIPRRYGLKQTIGDSMGIGGIFRGLRTIPFMLELLGDIAAVAPDALLINYTNPMSMLMWAGYEAFPDVRAVGLCHSIPNTAREIASYLGVDHEQLVYECAGINHIAWMTKLEVQGADVYPQLRAAMDDPQVYARDKVRFELLRRLGYFVTESSEHNAEYTPYWLKDDALIKRYDIPLDEYIRRSEQNLIEYAATRKGLLAGEPLRLEPSVELGGPIIHSLTAGTTRLVYGNVRNDDLIGNLPAGCCVEVPMVAGAAGLSPLRAGVLPPQLAATCLPHVAVQELVVAAALQGSRDHVYHAALLDRHAPSVLSPDALVAMVDDLIDAHGAALPEGIRR